jgi:hypothetical protein
LRAAQQDLPYPQQSIIKSTTLHVISCQQVICKVFIFLRRTLVFARLRPAPKIQDHLLPPSQQRDPKSLALRPIFCLQVTITAAAFVCRADLATRSRPARKISDRLLPPSQQEDLKSMAQRPTSHLQTTILFLVASIQNLLVLAFTCLSNNSIRQPQTKLEHRLTTPHHDEQSTTSTVVPVTMCPHMHWIRHPASYSMMQHQSRTALYHESAQANTYVPTPPSLTFI